MSEPRVQRATIISCAIWSPLRSTLAIIATRRLSGAPAAVRSNTKRSVAGSPGSTVFQACLKARSSAA